MVTFLGGSIDRLWIACISWKSIILTNMMNNPFPGVQIVGTAQGDLSRKKNRTWGGLGCQSLLSPYLSLSLPLRFFFALIFSALWLRAAPNYLNTRNRLMTNMFATHFYPFFFSIPRWIWITKSFIFIRKKKNTVVIVITLRYHREDGILHSFTSFT